VALTAPYMHDGSVPTLAAAVKREVFYRGLEAGRPLVLTPQEKSDLVAFLEVLTSRGLPGPSLPRAPLAQPPSHQPGERGLTPLLCIAIIEFISFRSYREDASVQ
jgi:hypothetical protein